MYCYILTVTIRSVIPTSCWLKAMSVVVAVTISKYASVEILSLQELCSQFLSVRLVLCIIQSFAKIVGKKKNKKTPPEYVWLSNIKNCPDTRLCCMCQGRSIPLLSNKETLKRKHSLGSGVVATRRSRIQPWLPQKKL